MNNNFDRIYQKKLSIYDLIIAKNKNKKNSIKEKLRKQLSNIEPSGNSKIKINDKKITKTVPEEEKTLTIDTEIKLKKDLNVILTGKSIQEKLGYEIPADSESENFLLRKMDVNIESFPNISIDSGRLFEVQKRLAMITDLGTTQKYNLTKRKEKLIPLSTLKQKHAQNLSSSISRKVLPKESGDCKVSSEEKDVSEDTSNRYEESLSKKDSVTNDNIEARQRKRSKIRSVEEIISSLKSEDYLQSQKESDKRIDDLIKMVLERTNEEDEEEDKNETETLVENVIEDIDVDTTEKSINEEINVEEVLNELENNQDVSEIDLSEEEEMGCVENLVNKEVPKIQIKPNESEIDQVELKKLLLDSQYNLDVTCEDMISVQGFHLPYNSDKNISSMDDVKDDYIPLNHNEIHKGIHELCMMQKFNKDSNLLLKQQWVENFIPDKYPYHKENIIPNSSDESRTVRIEHAAERIINQAEEIEKWRIKALEMLDKNQEIEIIGNYISPSFPKIHDIWQPSNPKLIMTPNRARQLLCPTYNKNFDELSTEEVSRQNTFENISTFDYQSSEDNSCCNEIDLEALEIRERLISRRVNSLEHLNNTDPKNKLKKRSSKSTRSSSVPNRHWLEEDSLIIHLEYHQIMEEINIQKQHIKNLKSCSNDIEPEIVENDIQNDPEIIEPENNISNTIDETVDETNTQDQTEKRLKENYFSDAEKELLAGRNYIYYPPRKTRSSKKKRATNIARISAIEKFLEKTPNQLEKTLSFDNITKELGKKTKKNKHHKLLINKFLCKSLTNVESFDGWSKDNGYKNDLNARDWITVVWDQWFDEVYPPLPENLTDLTTNTINSQNIQQEDVKAKEISSNDLNEIISLPEKIEPVLEEVEEEFREQVIETLYSEIKNITMELEKSDKPNAFLLSRRGAINRKLGFLAAAFRDLNEAISIEPNLITAYWERHLLHLVCNKTQAAIEDLNFILKKDKNNVAAYKSRANIYASIGDMSLAISNLSQAIRLSPEDTDAYAKRAKLYDENEEHRLALEDYNQLIRLQPNNYLAMMKHGLYYMNIEQWQLAVTDFSNVLRHYPLNTEAWLQRGIAYSKLSQWKDSLIDFSAVIHLDPNNHVAYFKRGCLLRKAEPYLAIRDFSISLLLESSETNIMSYLYRGILYATTKQYSEAIVDFEIVICFNKDMSFAHINLSLVYFENEDYEKAIKYMTSGLAADPTYIRAYACRAEACFKLQKYEEALKDINRAIHLHPDRSNYYMLRGDFYLAMDKMEMAAICVRQAAEISHNLGQSPVQQALVHSFLQHYDKAIDALMQATRNKPSITLLTLLGTTQMKAKRWKDAITSFSICLEQLKPKSQFKPWPPGAANLYFMVAQCYLELKKYKQSQQAFSATVKINPNHAEAYYQQGWCRLRLGKTKKGILDLNKALAINPKLYEAYLARATLFGFKNQFTKAILNCNEVLAIEPRCLRAYLYRGVLKFKIKAYSLAVKDFTEAIKIDPNCILAYFNRAICFNAEKQKYQKAIQDYSVVLLLNDALQLHYKAFINRGIVYLELGDIQNALHDFIHAQSIQPNNVYVLYVIGLCYHKLRNLNEAIHVFSRCLESDSKFILAKVARGNAFMDYNTNHGRELASKDYSSVLEIDSHHLDALVNLGFCRQAQGKFKKAWDIFTEAIQKHPKSEKPLDGRAIVCMQMRDLNGALKDLNEAIRIQPQNSMLFTNRGVVYQLMRDGIRAMKDYNKAVLIGGHNHEIALYNMGCVYLHNFQLEQASECFIKTLDTDPSDEAAWINLALVFVFRDKLEESIEYINKSISLAPNVAYLYYNKATVLYNLQKYKDAEENFSICLKLAPDNAHVHKVRADCRSKLNNTSGALEDYKLSVYISSSLQKMRS